MDIKSCVEVWQDDGPRITLGTEAASAAIGDDAVTNPTNATPNGGRRTASTPTPTTERRRTLSDRRPSFLRRRETQPEPPEPPAQPTIVSIPEVGEAPLPSVPETQPLFPPLPLDATDVHLLGQLQINPPNSGAMFKSLVQSFSTPEVTITYVLEVGLQPNPGPVREAFGHVWGGGLIEVVLGARD